MHSPTTHNANRKPTSGRPAQERADLVDAVLHSEAVTEAAVRASAFHNGALPLHLKNMPPKYANNRIV